MAALRVGHGGRTGRSYRQLREPLLQLDWWRQDQCRAEHGVQVCDLTRRVRAARAVSHVLVELRVVPEIVDQQPLSYVCALHTAKPLPNC